jgi:hypothetical protein
MVPEGAEVILAVADRVPYFRTYHDFRKNFPVWEFPPTREKQDATRILTKAARNLGGESLPDALRRINNYKGQTILSMVSYRHPGSRGVVHRVRYRTSFLGDQKRELCEDQRYTFPHKSWMALTERWDLKRAGGRSLRLIEELRTRSSAYLYVTVALQLQRQANRYAEARRLLQIIEAEVEHGIFKAVDVPAKGTDVQSQERECGICKVEYGDGPDDCREPVTLPCPCVQHFGKACVFKWILEHDECPNCRAVLNLQIPESLRTMRWTLREQRWFIGW